MSEVKPTPADAGTARAWREAWFTVWSPWVAWVGSAAVLMVSNLFPWWGTAVAGLTVGLCALTGGFVATGTALDALNTTLGAPHASGREKARLACLSLFGLLVSLGGYGVLLVFGGFVALVSPFRDLQLG